MPPLADKALEAATALSKHNEDVVDLKRDTTVRKWMTGFIVAFQSSHPP
jgi:hypothetical protein